MSEELVKFVLVKRETGANPVRTRHRNSGAKPKYHWETGKMADALIDKPGDLPDFEVRMRKQKTTSNWLYMKPVRDTAVS